MRSKERSKELLVIVLLPCFYVVSLVVVWWICPPVGPLARFLTWALTVVGLVGTVLCVVAWSFGGKGE